MIAHMAHVHEVYPSCNLGAKQFETYRLLKDHKNKLHKELDSEHEYIEEIKDGEDTQFYGKMKKKKK